MRELCDKLGDKGHSNTNRKVFEIDVLYLVDILHLLLNDSLSRPNPTHLHVHVTQRQ